MIWSLTDSTAVSSFAPGVLFSTAGAKVDLLHVAADLCPTCHYHTSKDIHGISDLMLGDGADIENDGVICLLRRRVERIMVCIQTGSSYPIGRDLKQKQAEYKKKHPKSSAEVLDNLGFDGATASLFGICKYFRRNRLIELIHI